MKLSFVSCALAALLTPVAASEATCADGSAPKTYLLSLKDVRGSERMLSEVEATFKSSHAGGSVISVEACPNAVKSLGKLPGVESVELDFHGIAGVPGDEKSQGQANDGVNKRRLSASGKESTPWGKDRADQAALPLDDSYSADYDGEGVCVYILDTGTMITHNDFKGRITDGKNFAYPGKKMSDKDGHGTHCASTAAGTDYGIATKATIVPVKVLDDNGSGSWSDIMDGIDWAANDNSQCKDKRKIISMSLGGPKSKALDKVVENNKDVVIVVAAGNGGGDDACKSSPAGASGDHVVTVGSTNDRDDVSGFSSEGKCLDILAPGSDILAAGIKGKTSTDTMSGTSMATPQVAGICAQIWQQNPDMSATEIVERMAAIALPFVGSSRARSDTPQLLANTPREGFTIPRARSIDTIKGDTTMQIAGKQRLHTFAAFGATSFNDALGDGPASIVAAVPILACGKNSETVIDLDNANEINGNVALVNRGDCYFTSKVRAALNAGAVAVLVANNEKKGVVEMYPADGDKAKDITVPAVMIEKSAGSAITKELNKGGDPRIEVITNAPDPCSTRSSSECLADDLPAFHDAVCELNGKICRVVQGSSAPTTEPAPTAPTEFVETVAPSAVDILCSEIKRKKTCKKLDACRWRKRKCLSN